MSRKVLVSIIFCFGIPASAAALKDRKRFLKRSVLTACCARRIETFTEMSSKSSETICLKDIPTWTEHYKDRIQKLGFKDEEDEERLFSTNENLNDRVSLWKGDITTLDVNVIVNAANSSLLGGGGVDGAIHRAAGEELLSECKTLNGCEPGEAKLTGGYNLPAKHVIHTVGPISEEPKILKACYRNSFQLLLDNKLRSIAFPCIATGIYGYPNEEAAHVALLQSRQFLKSNADKVERVIFCVYQDEDWKIYEKLMQRYFPVKDTSKL